MGWCWRRRPPFAAAPTCAAPTWLARVALLRSRGQAACGAQSAEWPGIVALLALTRTGGLGTGKGVQGAGHGKGGGA
jgi:hypothetical protein